MSTINLSIANAKDYYPPYAIIMHDVIEKQNVDTWIIGEPLEIRGDYGFGGSPATMALDGGH